MTEIHVLKCGQIEARACLIHWENWRFSRFWTQIEERYLADKKRCRGKNA